MHCNHAQQQWKPWFVSLLWGYASDTQTPWLLLLWLPQPSTSVRPNTPVCGERKCMYLFIQTWIKCLLWKHVCLFISIHWKQQQRNIDGRFKRQVAKLLIHSLVSSLMCAFISPLYLSKDTHKTHAALMQPLIFGPAFRGSSVTV